MNIRRFVAADMRSALQMVRAAHGPDAVILSNRRTDEGVEIVAASNYDESVVQRALDDAQRRDTPAAASSEPPQAQAADSRNDSPAERWLRALAPDEKAVSPQPAASAVVADTPPAAIAEALHTEIADAGAGFPSFAELLGRRRAPAPALHAEDDGIPSQTSPEPTAPAQDVAE